MVVGWFRFVHTYKRLYVWTNIDRISVDRVQSIGTGEKRKTVRLSPKTKNTRLTFKKPDEFKLERNRSIALI